MKVPKKRITEFDSIELRTNSLLKPSAQSLTLCQPGINYLRDHLSNYLGTTLSDGLGIVDLCVIDLLAFSGCRISEVLRIEPYDIGQMGHITIKGLKGSNDRIIVPVVSISYWRKKMMGLLPLENVYSRYYFYRRFKQFGIYSQFDKKKHKSITHYFRHNLVDTMRQDDVKGENITKYLGHKNKSTTERYGFDR